MKITIEASDLGLALQMRRFVDFYPNYYKTFNIEPKKISDLGKGVTVFEFVVGNQDDVHQFSLICTSYKIIVRNGDRTKFINPMPVFGAYPEVMPELCKGGVEGLFREIAQECVATGLLTQPIAIALGLFQFTPIFDLTLGKANLTSKNAVEGHPRLHCTLGEYDAYEIWKDIGEGFLRHDVSSTSDYVDKSPLPEAGSTVIWIYKAIYRYKNEPIGNWSESVAVIVKGM